MLEMTQRRTCTTV